VTLRVFGLTGGIGSGKSTVARHWRARGLPVIDADELARAVVEPGSPGLAEIVAAFGPGVLDASGALDRPRLASLVFADEAARLQLNSITHPRVGALFAERTRALDDRGEPLCCYEVPLLFETRLAEAFRPIVVVTVPVEVQVARTVGRDGTTEDAARARIRAQMSLEEKARLADHVIDNAGSLEATLARADAVLDAVCAALGVDPRRYPRAVRG
jgi:dephospho-CoA kinase